MQVLLDSSTPGFNFVQVLVQDFLLQSLLKVTTPLEYVRKCYVQFVYFKKEKIKHFFNWLIVFTTSHTFSFVTIWFY